MPQSSRVLSRAAQVAEILREDIRRGSHGEFLPGELALASRLQVSRPTLRGALEILRREGMLRTIKGQRTRVHHARRQTSGGRTKTIAALAAVPHHLLNSFSLYLLGKLQEATQNTGHKLDLHCDPRLEFSCPSRSLERLIRQTNAACWVILSAVPAAVEFFRRRQVPFVAVGAMRPNAKIPFIDIDHQAMCRHAVQSLRSRGVNRIALIVPRDVSPGANERNELWRESFQQAGHGLDLRLRVFEMDYLEWGVRRTLDRVFGTFSLPVGFLVVRPKHVLAIMSHLMHAGMKLPRDASVISLGYESFLDFITPSVAHYRSNWDQFAQRLCRLTLRLATEGSLPLRPVLLKSRFHDGGSLPPKT